MSAFPQHFVSTTSHWQATNRGKTSLWDHDRTAPLPSDVVDYVIIGGGITGASLAYQLTREGAAGHSKQVVLVEAKDVASGASGRNGGHIAPASWQAFPTLTTPLSEGGAGLSEEQALDVLANEQSTLQLAQEIIQAEGFDVDFWKGKKLEVKTTDDGVAENLNAYQAYLNAKSKSLKHRDTPLEWELIEGKEAAGKISRLPTALAANRGPAGSCHPHRLTTALLNMALSSPSSRFSLYSWTPVSSLDSSPDGCWILDCGQRGILRATDVILCTNGHTRHLFPNTDSDVGLAEHVTPFRGHAALVTPPGTFSGENSLATSYAIERGPYLMTTPHAGIVLGVYNATALSEGLATSADIFNVEDDSVVLDVFRDWLVKFCPNSFADWGTQSGDEATPRVWSGIMGASRDHLPLIGPVPGQPGLWAAVAFHGHGMARILTCTRSLATQIANQGEWDDRLPRCFEITEERLKRAREQVPDIMKPEERSTA